MKASRLTKETILDFGLTDRGFPEFGVGDTVEVALFVKEGNKERIQLYTGDVIAMHKKGISSTFTVRKIGANNIGVEKIFPFHAPVISGIKVLKRGDICRSKLYYLRDRIGKAARIKERRVDRETKLAQAQPEPEPVEPEPVQTQEELVQEEPEAAQLQEEPEAEQAQDEQTPEEPEPVQAQDELAQEELENKPE